MKNNYLLILLLFFFFGCTQKKANKEVAIVSEKDSLSEYFSLANNLSLTKDKRKEYTKKAFEIVINQKEDSINRVNLFRVANRYYNINDWKNFNKTVQLVLNKAVSAKDTFHITKSYTYLGDSYDLQAIPDSAFLFYNKAEKIYIKPEDNIALSRILINKANSQYKIGDFLGAQNSVFNVLRKIKDEKKVNNLLYDAYNLLGLIYNELGEYDNAIIYSNKALNISNDESIPKEFQARASSFNNIGFLYLNLKKYSVAKNYFQKGLEEKNLNVQKPNVYIMLLDNLAYSKFKLKDADGLPDLYYNALKLCDSLKLSAGTFVIKMHLSEYYASKTDTVKAIEFSNEALSLARGTKVSRDILVALKQLSIIEPEKASVYSKEYIRINDELQKEERSMGDKFSRIEYETDKIKDENTTLADQNRNLVYAFSFVTILGLFLYIIKAQKTKNRELLYKQQQQKANEDIYNLMISQQNTIETNRVKEKKRVAQELHDGVLGRMFGVRMNLDGLNGFNDEMAIKQRISYLTELKNIEQDIREISHDLNREKSELINNFVTIVDNLLEKQRNTFKTKLVSSIDRNIKWELLVNAVKINLYRIIQESLQNINKYANASAIQVEIRKQDDNIVLAITDNGDGFNVKVKKKGIGMQNMLSRTKECQGTFNVKSKKGEGTSITVIVPLEQKQIPS